MSQVACAIDGCRRPRRYRDWCGTHYERWRKHGDPLAIMPHPRQPVEDRFWSKVVPAETGCWLWHAHLNHEGYGEFKGLTTRQAHRIAYELLIGPIPDGLQLDHLCRVRACVNPTHLEPVTGAENRRRGTGWPARNHLVERCPKGHPYDLLNTYVSPTGGRGCRECRQDATRRYRARRDVA